MNNTTLLTKILAVSGGMAFTMIGVALFRRRMKRIEEPEKNKAREWEAEKAILQKDKELLEQKLFELENILERMRQEIESLKASLKEKQKQLSAQELEKERLHEQERRARKESDATIEQLQRRAQNFLRELEAKSILCDTQHQQLLNIEAANKQLQAEKQQLCVEIERKDEELRRWEGEVQVVKQGREQAVQDLKYLLANFVFKHPSQLQQQNGKPLLPNGEHDYTKLSPLIVGIESVRDPTLVSICRKYAQQQGVILPYQDGHDAANDSSSSDSDTHNATEDDGANGGNGKEDTISFTVSVDGVNGKKKYFAHPEAVPLSTV